jgi:hypothetical protein
MDFSEWLKPDDVTGRLFVGVFLPVATIVVLTVIANLLWYRVGISRSTASGLSAYRVAARGRPPVVDLALGTVVTVLLLAAQIVWLWSASRIANGVSYLWNAPLSNGRVDLDALTSHSGWDWIATSYLLASIVALIASYASALGAGRRDVVGGSTIVLALPVMLPWGLFCLVGSLFALVLAGIRTLTDDSPRLTDHGRAFIAVTLVVLSYLIALNLALRATKTVAAVGLRVSLGERGDRSERGEKTEPIVVAARYGRVRAIADRPYDGPLRWPRLDHAAAGREESADDGTPTGELVGVPVVPVESVAAPVESAGAAGSAGRVAVVEPLAPDVAHDGDGATPRQRDPGLVSDAGAEQQPA